MSDTGYPVPVKTRLAAAHAAAAAFVAARRGWSGGATMVAGTEERLADQAIAARGGADLYRFQTAGRIPDSALKSNSDGTATIKGVELCKTGTFNGLNLGDADLLAMVHYFEELRDAGIFLPPFRLDHSWSVLSVIGYFEELGTERRLDETDGVERLFLTGDIRLTGSVDYTPAVLVDAIKRGALRLRSSEIGYYVTNAGREIPLAFYGCAFVDIPAVEGLAPIGLSRATRRAEPHSITNLNASTEENPAMDPKKLARLKFLRALRAGSGLSTEQAAEATALDAEANEAGVSDDDVEAAEGDGSEPIEVEPEPAEVETPPDPAAPPAPENEPVEPVEPAEPVEPVTAPEDGATAELAAAHARIAALEQAEQDRAITALREAGAIVQANESDAESLLRHSDPEVRRAAGAVLAGIPAVVTLGRTSGRTTLSSTPGQNAGVEGLGLIGMSGEDGGALWASLSSEEREKHREEYAAWTKHRQENGIRD